ncbi:Sec-independent protein translocase subunit TatA [Scrofimicrobium sp. R131]|uniref:Sec-independent protein translocase protein TatA n=1 Tax=Scrofimicrobium appendicitidis TaxID=3079930 RepID=A0AAU7V5G6_9ACTO
MRPSHWIIVILVVIIIFGAAKLPDIARSIGQSAKILKKEMRELQEEPPAPQTYDPNAVPPQPPTYNPNVPQAGAYDPNAGPAAPGSAPPGQVPPAGPPAPDQPQGT